jgi:glycosyltransferase involved in cell wall biosynthesis
MTKASQPVVTVCIPVYNCEQYVGAAIESVLGQTWGDFELVVLDNCSTDRTPQVIRGYDDPRLRIITNDANIGAAGNWNKALAEARGEFLKIVCADDILYPTCLEEQLAPLRQPENRNVVMACCGRDVINEQGQRLMKRAFRGASGRLPGKRAIGIIARTGTNRIGEPTAVLLRTAVLRSAGAFDGDCHYVIDVDYWCRVLLHGDLWVLPQSLCAFRVSGGSWSVQALGSQGRDFCCLLDKMYRTPVYGVGWLAWQSGRMRTLLNMQLRRIFYRFVLPGKTES